MDRLLPIFLSITVICAVSCTGAAPGTPSSQDQPSIYSEKHLKQIGASDYDGAMSIVDKGERTGNLSPFDAALLRARLTYQYTQRYSDAVRFCKKALDCPEAQTDARTRTEVLYTLGTMSLSARDLSTCLSACTEGKKIAHDNGWTFKMHSFDCLAGHCLFSMEREEEGLTMMREAIAGAEAAARTKEEQGHLLFFEIGLIHCYEAIQDSGAVLEQCDNYERMIGKMEALADADDRLFLDRSHFCLELSRAIAHLQDGHADRAEAAWLRCMQNAYAQTEDGAYGLAKYYALTGDVQTLRKILEQEIPFDEDTVSREYRLRLSWMETACRKAGLTEEAELYADRIAALSELILLKEHQEGALSIGAGYHTQMYQLSLADMIQSARKLNRMYILLIILSLTVLAGMTVYFHRRTSSEYKEQFSQAEAEISRLQKQVSLIVPPVGKEDRTGKESQLASLVEGEKLYLDKELSRTQMVEMLGCTQQAMTRMLNEIHPGLSFPDYIKSLRIRHALMLMQRHPDWQVSRIADESGFYNIRTFQRAFQSITGKTPREHLKTLRSGGGINDLISMF